MIDSLLWAVSLPCGDGVGPQRCYCKSHPLSPVASALLLLPCSICQGRRWPSQGGVTHRACKRRGVGGYALYPCVFAAVGERFLCLSLSLSPTPLSPPPCFTLIGADGRHRDACSRRGHVPGASRGVAGSRLLRLSGPEPVLCPGPVFHPRRAVRGCPVGGARALCLILFCSCFLGM